MGLRTVRVAEVGGELSLYHSGHDLQCCPEARICTERDRPIS
jgi:hypothetical protein